MAMRRVFKGLAIALAALVVVALLAVTGLWWWSGSEGSLAWVLARIERTQPVTAEGVRGSLRSGLRIHRLTWERTACRCKPTTSTSRGNRSHCSAA